MLIFAFWIFLIVFVHLIFVAQVESQVDVVEDIDFTKVWTYSQLKDHTSASKPMDTKALHALAKKNYPKYIKCLKNSPHAKNLSTRLRFPNDAEEHYRSLIRETEKFRGGLPHNFNGYAGPWIENFFVYNFIFKPLSHFSGLIPLYIQWTDVHVRDVVENPNRNNPDYISTYKTLVPSLIQKLREDVIYVTVIQDDEGFKKLLAETRPNILVLSAGGFGHMAIPLIKGELSWLPPPSTFVNDVGFFGTLRGFRHVMLETVNTSSRCADLKVLSGRHDSWIKSIHETKFNLAPRGFGRTSFRLAEIIQLGRFPVYIYDDVPWYPYGNSEISVSRLGIVIHHNETEKLCDIIKAIPMKELQRRLERIKAAREEYTYRGVIRQIDRFFHDPFGRKGGNLVCVRFPDKET